MSKQIVIAEQHRIAAVFSKDQIQEQDQIQELIVATGTHQVSDIYLGIVENVLPGIDAAFVNIGDSERNGFIHVSDLGPLKKSYRNLAPITELLEPQQKVLVQVMKEPTGNKGPRLTGNISLPGRYLVLMPYGRSVNLSRRIRSENERNRLRALAILIKPSGMGLVVRTEAEGMLEEAIIEDLEMLQRQWETVMQEATTTRAPALLNRDDDFIQRVLRDVYSADVNRIVVDSHTGLKRVKQHLLNWYGGKAPQGVLIDHHRDRLPILDYFRINAAIREALTPRVDLPSGGYIIIERTEALTVIDVNSGSFTRSTTARETVLWTNCEAATEIARQLRLRNIAGVIVIDFIDMDSHRDKLQVLEHFTKALRADKARPQIAQLTELGLVELTRKRQGKNIYELFGRACPTCGGLGHLVHLPGEIEDGEVEPIERPAIAARERLPEMRVIGEDRSLNLEEEDDTADFGVSHPSYQDVNNNRRRRRRIGEEPRERERSKAAPWEEGRTSNSPILPAPISARVDPAEADPFSPADESGFANRPNRNDRQRGRGGRQRPNGRESLIPNGGSSRETAFAPEPMLAEGDRESALAAEVSYPEERRGRRRDGHRPPPEPPETVVVEMTPEEQDVYAWMGISPLVLANQEVKNPRSAIVSVVLPGQTPPQVRALLTAEAVDNELEPIAPEPIAPEPSVPEPIAPEPSVPDEISPYPINAVADEFNFAQPEITETVPKRIIESRSIEARLSDARPSEFAMPIRRSDIAPIAAPPVEVMPDPVTAEPPAPETPVPETPVPETPLVVPSVTELAIEEPTESESEAAIANRRRRRRSSAITGQES
jgi:ribonuclease E